VKRGKPRLKTSKAPRAGQCGKKEAPDNAVRSIKRYVKEQTVA
jgi:hypothetical protein